MKYIIKVEPTERSRHWRVIEEFSYGGIKIPVGFVFDGASIPIGLRWLFPHGGRKFAAAGIHDYCYRTGCVTKSRADLLFYKIMRANKVKPWKAKAMYLGVKHCGSLAWNKRRRQDG